MTTSWNASTATELREITAVIHDSYCDADQITFDEAAGCLSIPFAQRWDWPPLNEQPEWMDAPPTEVVRRSWRYTEERVPFMCGLLTRVPGHGPPLRR